MTQPATSPFAAYRDLVSAATLAYLDAERSASRIRWFEPLVIPGLLQTPDYTRELMTQVHGWDAARTERMVELRRERQLSPFLNRTDVALDLVVDEAVLRKVPFWVEDAQEERWLEHLAEHPNISIRVIAGLHPGLAGPYTLLDTPAGCVLHREDRDETHPLGAGEVGEWAGRHERLREAAVDTKGVGTMSDEVYLGDGLYASFDGYYIALTADKGSPKERTVFLDPAGWAPLVRLAEKAWQSEDEGGE